MANLKRDVEKWLSKYGAKMNEVQVSYKNALHGEDSEVQIKYGKHGGWFAFDRSGFESYENGGLRAFLGLTKSESIPFELPAEFQKASAYVTVESYRIENVGNGFCVFDKVNNKYIKKGMDNETMIYSTEKEAKDAIDTWINQQREKYLVLKKEKHENAFGFEKDAYRVVFDEIYLGYIFPLKYFTGKARALNQKPEDVWGWTTEKPKTKTFWDIEKSFKNKEDAEKFAYEYGVEKFGDGEEGVAAAIDAPSAMIDAALVVNGITVYHGGIEDFDVFDKTKSGEGESGDIFGAGFYLTDSEKTAQFYAHQVALKQFVERYTNTGIQKSPEPVYFPNAEEKAKEIERILEFRLTAKLLDAETYIIDDEFRNHILDLWVAHSGFPISSGLRSFDFLRGQGNKEKIKNYRGELPYIIQHIGMGTKEIVDGIIDYIKQKKFDGIKYASDPQYEGDGAINYVVYNTNCLARIKTIKADTPDSGSDTFIGNKEFPCEIFSSRNIIQKKKKYAVAGKEGYSDPFANSDQAIQYIIENGLMTDENVNSYHIKVYDGSAEGFVLDKEQIARRISEMNAEKKIESADGKPAKISKGRLDEIIGNMIDMARKGLRNLSRDIGANDYKAGQVEKNGQYMAFISFKARTKNYNKGLRLYIYYNAATDEYLVEGIVTIGLNIKNVGTIDRVQVDSIGEAIRRITDGEKMQAVDLIPKDIQKEARDSKDEMRKAETMLSEIRKNFSNSIRFSNTDFLGKAKEKWMEMLNYPAVPYYENQVMLAYEKGQIYDALWSGAIMPKDAVKILELAGIAVPEDYKIAADIQQKMIDKQASSMLDYLNALLLSVESQPAKRATPIQCESVVFQIGYKDMSAIEDLKGDKKPDWMRTQEQFYKLPSKEVTIDGRKYKFMKGKLRDGKNFYESKTDYIVALEVPRKLIIEALIEGKYHAAIKEGRMTAYDATYIMQSANVTSPNLFELSGMDTSTQIPTIVGRAGDLLGGNKLGWMMSPAEREIARGAVIDRSNLSSIKDVDEYNAQVRLMDTELEQYQIDCVKKALNSGEILKAIEDGKLTAMDAVYLIQQSNLRRHTVDVPQVLFCMAHEESVRLLEGSQIAAQVKRERKEIGAFVEMLGDRLSDPKHLWMLTFEQFEDKINAEGKEIRGNTLYSPALREQYQIANGVVEAGRELPKGISGDYNVVRWLYLSEIAFAMGKDMKFVPMVAGFQVTKYQRADLYVQAVEDGRMTARDVQDVLDDDAIVIPDEILELAKTTAPTENTILGLKTDLLGEPKQMLMMTFDEYYPSEKARIFADANSYQPSEAVKQSLGKRPKYSYRVIGTANEMVGQYPSRILAEQAAYNHKQRMLEAISADEIKRQLKKVYENGISAAIDNGYYQIKIRQGRMTTKDAERIIDSAGYPVPNDIAQVAKSVDSAKAEQFFALCRPFVSEWAEPMGVYAVVTDNDFIVRMKSRGEEKEIVSYNLSDSSIKYAGASFSGKPFEIVRKIREYTVAQFSRYPDKFRQSIIDLYAAVFNWVIDNNINDRDSLLMWVKKNSQVLIKAFSALRVKVDTTENNMYSLSVHPRSERTKQNIMWIGKDGTMLFAGKPAGSIQEEIDIIGQVNSVFSRYDRTFRQALIAYYENIKKFKGKANSEKKEPTTSLQPPRAFRPNELDIIFDDAFIRGDGRIKDGEISEFGNRLEDDERQAFFKQWRVYIQLNNITYDDSGYYVKPVAEKESEGITTAVLSKAPELKYIRLTLPSSNPRMGFAVKYNAGASDAASEWSFSPFADAVMEGVKMYSIGNSKVFWFNTATDILTSMTADNSVTEDAIRELIVTPSEIPSRENDYMLDEDKYDLRVPIDTKSDLTTMFRDFFLKMGGKVKKEYLWNYINSLKPTLKVAYSKAWDEYTELGGLQLRDGYYINPIIYQEEETIEEQAINAVVEKPTEEQSAIVMRIARTNRRGYVVKLPSDESDDKAKWEFADSPLMVVRNLQASEEESALVFYFDKVKKTLTNAVVFADWDEEKLGETLEKLEEEEPVEEEHVAADKQASAGLNILSSKEYHKLEKEIKGKGKIDMSFLSKYNNFVDVIADSRSPYHLMDKKQKLEVERHFETAEVEEYAAGGAVGQVPTQRERATPLASMNIVGSKHQLDTGNASLVYRYNYGNFTEDMVRKMLTNWMASMDGIELDKRSEDLISIKLNGAEIGNVFRNDLEIKRKYIDDDKFKGSSFAKLFPDLHSDWEAKYPDTNTQKFEQGGDVEIKVHDLVVKLELEFHVRAMHISMADYDTVVVSALCDKYSGHDNKFVYEVPFGDMTLDVRITSKKCLTDKSHSVTGVLITVEIDKPKGYSIEEVTKSMQAAFSFFKYRYQYDWDKSDVASISIQSITVVGSNKLLGFDILDVKGKRLADLNYIGKRFKAILIKKVGDNLREGDEIILTPYKEGSRVYFWIINKYDCGNLMRYRYSELSDLYKWVENIQPATEEEYQTVLAEMERRHHEDYDKYHFGFRD